MRLRLPAPWLLLLLLTASGCASYSPMPLTHRAVERELAPPSQQAVRMALAHLHHPLLQPITFDLSDGLSPDEAALLAVVANPLLKAVKAARGEAAAQVIQAGLLPDPTLSGSMDLPFGADSGGKVTAYGVGLEWEITSLMGRNARLTAARAHRRSVDLAVAWREWQVAEAAKLHLYRLFFAKKRLSLAREREETVKRLYGMEERGVKIGAVSGDLLIQDRLMARRTMAARLRAEEAVRAEALRLKRILGVPGRWRFRLQRGISPPPPPSAGVREELLRGIEERRPDLLALKMGYMSQDERLRAAIDAQFPRLAIGVNTGRDTDSVKTVGMGITLSIPIFDHNQGMIAHARARRRRLFQEYAARLFEARSDIALLLQGVDATSRELNNARRALRECRDLARRRKRAVEVGELPWTSYYRTLLELNSREREVLDLKQRLTEFIIGLEAASGHYLTSPWQRSGRTGDRMGAGGGS